ncbi:uncharacterized protein LAESUDRAFT_718226 [Laetiporus sulphureus 93-53]|uniref:Crinkler effector protein N-terminal domain-containing protein n=1 Tax=Laetiporus sulphureus 93-53 TaxID=1314785 RepID=A0A165B5S9_9APHY|nr:uncharacterized protein LAESUDRAFT_718226 [Laetiporus sulphureus 93-53]KZT00302.1 hypothetical protein LAESUDRAFT_718226 [Laetiporus sulphureus 93-53]
MNIWCLLIDHEKKLIGTPFEVTVSSVDTVDRLRKKVKEDRSVGTAGVDSASLIVWRCIDPTTTLDDEDHETLEGQVSEAFFNQKVKRLGVRRTIADLKLSKDETLLVQMPSAF